MPVTPPGGYAPSSVGRTGGTQAPAGKPGTAPAAWHRLMSTFAYDFPLGMQRAEASRHRMLLLTRKR